MTTDGLGWPEIMTDWRAGRWRMTNDGPAKFTGAPTTGNDHMQNTQGWLVQENLLSQHHTKIIKKDED